VITSSSSRVDQRHSSIPYCATNIHGPWGALPRVSLRFQARDADEAIFAYTLCSRPVLRSCSHCIYRLHWVGYLPPRLLHTLFHIMLHHASPQACLLTSSRGIVRVRCCYSQWLSYLHIDTCSLSSPPVHLLCTRPSQIAVSIRYIVASDLLYSYCTYKSNTIYCF